MKKIFAALVVLSGSSAIVDSANAFGFGGGSSYGGYGGYGSSGYSSYAAYGNGGYASGCGTSGYSAAAYCAPAPARHGLFHRHRAASYANTGYGSSGYSSGYGSSGYSSGGYGSSGYSSGYGSSGYSSGYGSSGYSSGYGSSGYSSGYGSSGYSSGYGSSGYSSGYGSSGYSSGYGSSGSSGYGSSGYSGGYGSSGYGASTARSSNYSTAMVAPAGLPPAPAGYHWEPKNSAIAVMGDSNTSLSTNGTFAPSGLPPAPAGYHWEPKGTMTSDTQYGVGSGNSFGNGMSVDGPYPAPAGYHWERRGRTIIDGATPVIGTPSNTSGTGVELTKDDTLVAMNSNYAADEIQLSVRVPESAKVFVNGNATTSTGELRHFVSRGLDPAQEYRFEIRVEDSVAGKAVTDSQTIVLAPGNGESLKFDLRPADAAIPTILTLNVPATAKVELAGNGTITQGTERTFRTMELRSGEVWDDYKIVVTVDGTIKEKTIRLIAGDDVEVSFDFDAPAASIIAAR